MKTKIKNKTEIKNKTGIALNAEEYKNLPVYLMGNAMKKAGCSEDKLTEFYKRNLKK